MHSLAPTVLNKNKIFSLILLFALFSCQNIVKKNDSFDDFLAKKPANYNNAQSNSNDKHLYNTNCLGHCPQKTSNYSNIIVDHKIILLSVNTKTKFADWVAYKVENKNKNYFYCNVDKSNYSILRI